MMGRIHSFQSLGTLDGPGVRFVVFAQGCPLRCACCHNPDTWAFDGGREVTPQEILEKVLRCREYFGAQGGITFSGGEPLCQPAFVRETFTLCKEQGIHTCLDTSGCLLNDEIKELLAVTDLVLLDMKYTNPDDYRRYVGCEQEKVFEFLDYLNAQHIKTVLRQVIIPSVNDTEENVSLLQEIRGKYPCIEKVELLPFKKMCQVKYDSMGLTFPFADRPTPTKQEMQKWSNMLAKRV